MEQLLPAFAGLERSHLLPTHPGFGIVERPGERKRWRPTALYPGSDRIAGVYYSFDCRFSLLAKILAGRAGTGQDKILKRGISWLIHFSALLTTLSIAALNAGRLMPASCSRPASIQPARQRLPGRGC